MRITHCPISLPTRFMDHCSNSAADRKSCDAPHNKNAFLGIPKFARLAASQMRESSYENIIYRWIR
jgi:hypothetical protein